MDIFQLITALATNGIGAVCAGAVLWFSYYRETKTIPQMMATFQAVQDRSTAAFQSSHEASLKVFGDSVKDERATCQRWHESNLAQHKENREVAFKMVDELQTHRQLLLSDLKDQRHLLANLIHVLHMEDALKQKGVYKKAEAAP